jgi:hypothetical protein
MVLFRTLFGIDVIIALVFVYFFAVGLADGSISAFNIQLWIAILGGVAAVMVAGFVLLSRGNRRAADGILLILALPGVLFGLLMLSLIVLHPRWN